MSKRKSKKRSVSSIKQRDTASQAKPHEKQTSGQQRNVEGLNFREASIRTENSNDGVITVRMSVSSEKPVLTYADWNDRWQLVYEILDHSAKAVSFERMENGLVIQDTHEGDQIGLIREPEIKNGKLGGVVEFCTGQRAQDIARDAEKGLRTNCSVGYIVPPNSYELVKEEDGIPVVRAKSWIPCEGSFVSVPADTSVGVDRSAGEVAVSPASNKNQREEKTMNPKEVAELFERAAKFGIEASRVSALIADGKGRAELDAMIVDHQNSEIESREAKIQELNERKASEKPAMPDAENRAAVAPGDAAVPAEEMQRYSLMKVVRSMAGGKDDIGREREISDELAKQRGRDAEGIIIPHRALVNARALTVSGTSGATVATDLYSDQFIDALRARAILADLGVQILDGLVGDVAIPKLTASATVYWVAENENTSDGNQTLGQVTGTPHTAGMFTDLSRKLMKQSSPAVERFIAGDMLGAIAVGCQSALFQGTGADGQPSAITGAAGINNPAIGTAGTPKYSEILSFIGSIMTDNADVETMKWALPADVWELLASTTKDGGSGQFVLDPDKKSCCGYGYQVSSSVPAKSAFFGDWSTVVMAIWGSGVDFKVDDKTLSKSGGLRLVALQDVDVMVRQGKALAYNTAVND